MTTASPPLSAKTQRAEILRKLIDARGDWVPSPEIAACAQQYNARVFELRKDGFCIENRTETDRETGERRSWFRLVRGAPAKRSESTESPYMRRIREEREEAAPLFAGQAVQQ